MNSPRTSRRHFYRRLVPLLLLLGATGFAVATVRWALNQLPSHLQGSHASTSRGAERLATSTRVKNADGSLVVNATKPVWRIWLDAWLQSRRVPQTSSSQPGLAQPGLAQPDVTKRQPVWIDIETLARRHPAWRLADRLAAQEKPSLTHISRTAPVSPPEMRSFLKADITTSFWQAFQNRGSISSAGFSRDKRTVDGFLSPSQILAPDETTSTRTSREAAFAEVARAKQERALRNLTSDLGNNLSRERGLRTLEAREILDEEVAAARALGLLPPEPILLSAEEQLELTNLRLQLLPSSRLSPEEETVARRRYLYLQSRWDEALRRQELLHLAEIDEQREVEPRRIRTEGEAAITLSQSRLQIADAARLRALSQAQSNLMTRDFEQWRPLRNDFHSGTSFPASWSVLSSAFSPPPQGRSSTKSRSNLSVLRAPVTDLSAFAFEGAGPTLHRVLDAKSQPVGSNAQAAATLRAQARREAQLWAQIIAQREGWHRVYSPRTNRTKPVFNGTEAVWRAWQS